MAKGQNYRLVYKDCAPRWMLRTTAGTFAVDYLIQAESWGAKPYKDDSGLERLAGAHKLCEQGRRLKSWSFEVWLKQQL